VPCRAIFEFFCPTFAATLARQSDTKKRNKCKRRTEVCKILDMMVVSAQVSLDGLTLLG